MQGAGIFLDLLYSPIPQSMIPRLFIPVVCICLPLFLNGCASSGKSDAKDYTVALGTAYPNEAHIAQERVDKYLEHLKPDKKAQIMQNDYLAVESTEVPASEVPGLSGKIAGQAGGYTDRGSMMTKFIMVFDTKTGRLVGNEGYIAIDTPQKGRLGVFGGYTAVYIGNGK
jgi:hypothetical protein